MMWVSPSEDNTKILHTIHYLVLEITCVNEAYKL